MKRDFNVLDSYPVMLEINKVFSKIIFKVTSEREINFTIELKPNVDLISKTPYRMTTLEFCEL